MSDLDDFLGPDGVLSNAIEGWEHRPQQMEMARAVETMLDDRVPLIVEAATGTGKTLAYLVPALLSGRKTIVTTQTKALQEQLFHKDLPMLAEHWETPINAVLLKGRKNYLCKLRLDQMGEIPRFRTRTDARFWPRIKTWSMKTQTGDRAEIEGLPDDYATWNDLSVGPESCLGTKCPFHDECYVTKARRDATTADIIVVNHHLFFADLALRQEGHGEILPPYDAVIFDEAHHLESIATSYFGVQVSNYRFMELTGDSLRALDDEDIDSPPIEEAVATLERVYKDFFSNLVFGLYDGSHLTTEVLEQNRSGRIEEGKKEVHDALEELRIAVAKTSSLGEVGDRLQARVREVDREFAFALRADDERYVYFIERRERGTFLQACPIDVAETVRRKLLDTHDMMLFTSATLTTGGSFEYLKSRLGMEAFDSDDITYEEYQVRTLKLDPVFDYENQSLLYVPNRLGPPNSPTYVDDATTIIRYLLEISGGHAFVLFTSYANLNAIHDALADELPMLVLKQGDAPKKELLERFKEEPESVLFATSSFWEGVDVVGDALQMVIIDKLPFANPSDPLVRARCDLIDSRGGNAFMEYSVPSAALSLKQGFGRLIRSKTDLGVVAILDSRLLTKRYGSFFLETLPPARRVFRAAEVRDWWADHIG